MRPAQLDCAALYVYIVLQSDRSRKGVNVGKSPTFFYPPASPRFDVKTALEVIALEVLSTLGLDLVELRIGGSKRRPVLDVRIEKTDGEKVTVDDCARVSRALEQRLNEGVNNLDDYVLEVSSPGLERPLRRPQDWRRFVGETVSVLSPVIGGRRELELVAVESGEGQAQIVVFKDKRGADIRVPLAEVQEARLVFHWKR